MKFTIEPLRVNATTAMRRTGYRFQHRVEDTGELSFVREIGSNGYPRYHMYAKLTGARLDLSIHIDHKKHTYGNQTRHHGEYGEDGALAEEVERLKKTLGA